VAFPQTPLRITVEAALGADLTAAPSTWSWTDVTLWVRGDGITISPRGRMSEFSTAPPAKASWTLINTDGRWTERNPLGVWYGTIGFNTPVRILVAPDTNTASDTFNRTTSNGWGTAVVGGAWTVDGTAAEYSTTGSQARLTLGTAGVRRYATLPTSYLIHDVTVRIRTAALATGAALSAGVVFQFTDASNNNRGEIIFNTDQSIAVRHVVRSGGTDSPGATVVVSGLTHVANTFYRVRMQTHAVTGRAVRIKVWADNAAEPTVWNQWNTLGAGVVASGKLGLTGTRETGNTNANAVIEFDDFTFVDGPCRRHTGYFDNLPRRWADHSATVLYAPVTASGLSRRLQQGGSIKSAIKAAILSGTVQPRAYWPCEDGATSTQLATALPVGYPMTVNGGEGLASGQAAGSYPVLSATTTGLIRGSVLPYAPGDWNVQWLANIPSTPASNQALLRWFTATGGTYPYWQLVLTSGSVVRLEAYDSAGERLSDPGVTFPATAYGRQLWVEVTALRSGSDIAYTYAIFLPDGVTQVTGGGTKTTAVPGAVTSVAFGNGAGANALSGMVLGHIVVYDDTTVTNGVLASLGWGLEASNVRVGRLGRQESVALTMATPTYDFAVMGSPSATTLLGQLQEIESTEVGILFDDVDGGMTVLGREARYNRPVALTLDVTAHQLAVLEPDNDDQLLCNDATSSQPGGTAYRYQDTTSTRSVSRGVYPKPFSANVYSAADLKFDAMFRTAIGTVDDDRYTTVEFSLTGNPSLIAAWLACDIGSRVQITNAAALLNPDPIDLIIEGYQEFLAGTDWRVTLYTSSAKIWNAWIAESGSGNSSRPDSGTSTTAASYGPAVTSLSMVTTDPLDVWTTSGADLPIDIVISGEVVRVTAISGATSPQTFTVTRAINGVSKTLPAGSPVHLANASVLAL